ncbi:MULTISPECIES: BglG family transcription antiterminator [unclassified Paenibacillus]|uniref:BglG family transcription antiterminator n=1 Tax=unclassified Paenibacillus TaxID=185978 RepID=UPI000970FA22|nr:MULTISPECIES: BglG family transcription antiterminator [unclassified Paenibacillus]ASS64736.2 BglG family transcription antiterminator [Paenibacillus sp. RUD330]
MELTYRMRQILDSLLRPPYEITVAEIARTIRVSARTVHRELDAVESFLHRSGIMLRRKAGSGLSVEGDPERLEALRAQVLIPEEAEYSSDERQVYLLCRLLASKEPVKLFSLASEMKVTVPTVGADLDDLSEWTGKQGLLLIRRRGYGVEITGSEPLLREAVRAVVRLRLDDLRLIAGSDDQPIHPVDAMIAGMAGADRIGLVEEALWRWEEGNQRETLSEEAYTDLLVRLSIGAVRIEAGMTVSEGDMDRLAYARKSAASGHAAGEAAGSETGSAAILCRMLGEALGIAYSVAEAAYAAELLRRAASHSSGSLAADDLELAGKVRSFIRRMSELDGTDYSADRSLRDGLFAHLKAALERLGAGQRIRNPLLEAIRKEYPELYRQVRQAADSALPGFTVPDEEIAFLVMHFGASRERLRQVSQVMRAIVVCTSGIGSSKMIAVRLRKEFPQLQIVDQASWYEAARIPRSDYDLIISTVDLPLPEDQYLKLSPLLTPPEADRLREFIQSKSWQGEGLRPKPAGDAAAAAAELIKEWESPAAGPVPNDAGKASEAAGLAGLEQLGAATKQCIELLNAFRVLRLSVDGRPALEKWLSAACGHEALGDTVKDVHRVVDLLLRREENGTQLIPGTELALFHTRTDAVLKPSLLLFEMESALRLDGAEGPRLARFLLMLAPRQLSRESLEVLSEVSVTLLDDEMIQALAEGREDRIRALIASHLRGYLKTKLESE